MPADEFLLLILAGPSGSGKTTLTQRLLREFPDVTLSISYTTRAPRGSERDGVEYHFVDRARFVELVSNGDFLEWAEVHGSLYGTAASQVSRARETHRGVLFDVDFQGARQIRASVRNQDVVGVFLLPPSMAELERRLRTRGTDSEEVVARRLRKALDEIEHYAIFDYLVVNDSLDRAYDDVRAIVLAERARRTRRATIAETLLRPSRGGLP